MYAGLMILLIINDSAFSVRKWLNNPNYMRWIRGQYTN